MALLSVIRMPDVMCRCSTDGGNMALQVIKNLKLSGGILSQKVANRK